ncbi:hypothetical protein ZWY2020_025128 [Hordeum vulgare]|nr:hypothetical protein ZWY2020_025128 [Hordeum vulgare]
MTSPVARPCWLAAPHAQNLSVAQVLSPHLVVVRSGAGQIWGLICCRFPQALLLVVSNPVDVLAYLALIFLGLSSRRAASSAPVPISTPLGFGSSSTSPPPLTRRACSISKYVIRSNGRNHTNEIAIMLEVLRCRIPSPPQRLFNPEPVYAAPLQPYWSP